MRGYKTRRGGKRRSGTKRHQRGGARQHDQYMDILRDVNKLASESKGLYAETKLQRCRGLESAAFNHMLDTEKLFNDIRAFGRAVSVGGQALVPADVLKVPRNRGSDLDKMWRAGLINRDTATKELARR